MGTDGISEPSRHGLPSHGRGSGELETDQAPQLTGTESQAAARLRRWSEESVIETDRKRFVAAAEETLAGIHEGNFARYRARPSGFEAWKAVCDPANHLIP